MSTASGDGTARSACQQPRVSTRNGSATVANAAKLRASTAKCQEGAQRVKLKAHKVRVLVVCIVVQSQPASCGRLTSALRLPQWTAWRWATGLQRLRLLWPHQHRLPAWTAWPWVTGLQRVHSLWPDQHQRRRRRRRHGRRHRHRHWHFLHRCKALHRQRQQRCHSQLSWRALPYRSLRLYHWSIGLAHRCLLKPLMGCLCHAIASTHTTRQHPRAPLRELRSMSQGMHMHCLGCHRTQHRHC